MTEAQNLAPASTADLAPTSRTSTPCRPVAGARQRLDLIVTTLALPSGSAANVDSQSAENLLTRCTGRQFLPISTRNQPASDLRAYRRRDPVDPLALLGLLGQAARFCRPDRAPAIAAWSSIAARVSRSRRAHVADEPATAGDDPSVNGPSRSPRTARRLSGRRFDVPSVGAAGHRRPAGARRSRWTTRECSRPYADADLLAVLAPAAASFRQGVVWRGKRRRLMTGGGACPGVKPSGGSPPCPGGAAAVSRPPLSAMLTLIAALASCGHADQQRDPSNDRPDPSSAIGRAWHRSPLQHGSRTSASMSPDHRELRSHRQ